MQIQFFFFQMRFFKNGSEAVDTLRYYHYFSIINNNKNKVGLKTLRRIFSTVCKSHPFKYSWIVYLISISVGHRLFLRDVSLMNYFWVRDKLKEERTKSMSDHFNLDDTNKWQWQKIKATNNIAKYMSFVIHRCEWLEIFIYVFVIPVSTVIEFGDPLRFILIYFLSIYILL